MSIIAVNFSVSRKKITKKMSRKTNAAEEHVNKLSFAD